MTIHRISNARREHLESHFVGWSFGKPDDFRPSRAVFVEITSAPELFYIAYVYNWDDENDVLLWILDSPHCSRSTANLLFWRALPREFEETDFDDPATCPDYCEPGFDVIKRVLAMYRTGVFAPTALEFDPAPVRDQVRIVNPFWTVPEGLFDKIDGDTIDVEFS
jgi:hypothetical protein